MKNILLMGILSMLLCCALQAQTFNSGSTGADGALDLTSGDRVVQLPESGILNYTTVNIPVGKVLSFIPNSRNTPILLLAQSNIIIAGRITIDALNRQPGPGGFYGGEPNRPGFGPGAGQGGAPGTWIGSLSLVPIIGGSGGSGNPYGAGGGGGGAIVIASSASVILTVESSISAEGGVPGSGLNHGGAGGAIRIVANSVQAKGHLNALGGLVFNVGRGGNGIIRLEAPQGALFYTGSASPSPILSSVNHTINPPNAPLLTIASIGGYAVPSNTVSRPDAIDLILPKQLSDPISVVVKGINIPVGTQINIKISGPGNPVATGSALAGSLQSTSATLNISGLDKNGAITNLYVYATFDLPQISQNFNAKGKDQIAQVKIEAAPGGKPKYIFLRNDGSEVERQKVPSAILEQFGELEK